MKLSKRRLKRIIKEERKKLQEEIDRVSELNEFVGSRGGKKLMQEGSRVSSAGRNIGALGHDQTGAMRRTLTEIGTFIENLGSSLENLNSISEDMSATDSLPTVAEFKKMIKEIQRLEK